MSETSISVHVGQGAWTTCHRYLDHPPILGFYLGTTSLAVCNQDSDRVTAADVGFAQSLVESARDYLAECQRLCPDHTDRPERVA